MEVEKQKSITDMLPIKKFTYDELQYDSASNEYYRVDDVEMLLEKLSQPGNLAKVTKSLMFGGKLELEDLLK